jgi:hypothetical protein
MEINIDELRSLTSECIRLASEKARKDAEDKVRKEAEFKASIEHIANTVLEGIPRKAKAAAKQGGSKVEVWRFSKTCHQDAVALRLIQEECAKANLKTEVGYWDDGAGFNGGDTLVVSWN